MFQAIIFIKILSQGQDEDSCLNIFYIFIRMGAKVKFHNYKIIIKNVVNCWVPRKRFQNRLMELLKVAATSGYNGKLGSPLSLPGRIEDNHVIVITRIAAHIFILSFFN